MPESKRRNPQPKRQPNQANRQAMSRRAQRAAAAAARRRRKRIGIAVTSLAVVLVGGLIAWNMLSDDDSTDIAATNTTLPPTTTSGPPAGSAAGKPCVPVADPLPAGAPAVPVKVGPPPTELIKEDLKPGTGAEVTAGATVTAHYIGVSCSTGKIFDSSYSRGSPTPFSLAEVIPGWTNGLPGMKVGGQRLLGIPSDQAYGAAGRPPDIGPDETLWFVVEIVETKPA